MTKKGKKCFLFTGSVLLAIFLTHGPGAAVFTVNSVNDTRDVSPGDGIAADAAGKTSLRAAIMEANALPGADTIVLPAGKYMLSIYGPDEEKCRSGDLDIRGPLTIRGAGAGKTVIDARWIDRVFHIIRAGKVSLEELTVKNGRCPKAPQSHHGFPGGGIFHTGGDLNIKNCVISHNEAGEPGDKARLSETLSGGSGGGIYNNSGILTMEACVVEKNRTGAGDQRLFMDENSRGNGGGICSENGKVQLTSCEIRANLSCNCGGGICSRFMLPGDEAALEIIESDVSVNEAHWSGGGLALWGGAHISRSLIHGNSAGFEMQQVNSCYGGGIMLFYPFEGNGAFSRLDLINSTVAHNWLNFNMACESRGGGIAVLGCYSGQARIQNCTITKNSAQSSGGIYYLSAWEGICGPVPHKVSVGNSVIAENSDVDLSADVTSLGYNLIGTFSRYTVFNKPDTDLISVEPRLGLLRDNGGPTMTCALLPESPAIDAGNPDNKIPFDQRGVQRPKDGNDDRSARCDIGAFELSRPRVEILLPTAGSAVFGTVSVEARALDCSTLEFYVNSVLKQTVSSAPWSFQWDSTTVCNGVHKISLKACDRAGSSGVCQCAVQVKNVVLTLDASRVTDHSWLVQKTAAKLEVRVDSTADFNNLTFQVFCCRAEGPWNQIKEVHSSDFSGSSFVCYDPDYTAEAGFAYQVVAVDGSGMVVGRSPQRLL